MGLDSFDATKEQNQPVGNDGPDCWLLVLKDMEVRRLAGINKYGHPVRPFNGRDPLVDAYQEALDLCVYLRQVIEERRRVNNERTTTTPEGQLHPEGEGQRDYDPLHDRPLPGREDG